MPGVQRCRNFLLANVQMNDQSDLKSEMKAWDSEGFITDVLPERDRINTLSDRPA
jgi:hypothetical protein